jgi:thioredoxin reductase (NADPH)
MSTSYLYVVLFAAATIVLYLLLQGRKDRKNRKKMLEAERAGLLEPVSLHPVIDPNRCLGSGSCVLACPEGDVLGMIKRRAQLINPSHCIGHGACKSACPHDAITLVFGSARRGVDIPTVSPNFETNVPGIFIAGELGGMGLIRNAVEQGRQAMEGIRKRRAKGKRLDVVIIGAGPAGFSASLAAMQHKLRSVTVEQDTLGGTVAHFPRGKLVMTQPVKLPIIGKVRFTETSKEKLLAFWKEVEQKTGVKINYRERMEDIARDGDGFVVTTSRGKYETRNVLLTIGRRGTPRKLGVPGEEQGKVVYRLTDAEQYRGQHVLVVGGGDAALEAACSIADEPGTRVTLSYRSDSFSRAKEKNRDRVNQAEAAGRLKVMLSSNVKEILPSSVRIELGGKLNELPNDAVIVCAGGILPTPFLKKIGIAVDTKYGTA